jgi:hypothetical protein
MYWKQGGIAILYCPGTVRSLSVRGRYMVSTWSVHGRHSAVCQIRSPFGGGGGIGRMTSALQCVAGTLGVGQHFGQILDVPLGVLE